jgi:hypothetical protein
MRIAREDPFNGPLLRQIADMDRRLKKLESGIEVPVLVNWTPVVVQPGTLAINVRRAVYQLRGPTIWVYADLSVASGSGTAGQIIWISVPVDITNNSMSPCIGSFQLWTGAISYVGAVTPNSNNASQIQFWVNGASNILGNNPSYAFASGHRISFTIEYEPA